MTVLRASWLLLLSLSASAGALANPPPAKAFFTKRPLNSEVREEVTSAIFSDELCFHASGFASDGEHLVEVAVFDAGGREVVRMVKNVTTRGATWGISFCPSPIPDVDMPGEWWFVATLDDANAVSASIPIAYSQVRPIKRIPAEAAVEKKQPAAKEKPVAKEYPRARQATDRK